MPGLRPGWGLVRWAGIGLLAVPTAYVLLILAVLLVSPPCLHCLVSPRQYSGAIEKEALWDPWEEGSATAPADRSPRTRLGRVRVAFFEARFRQIESNGPPSREAREEADRRHEIVGIVPGSLSGGMRVWPYLGFLTAVLIVPSLLIVGWYKLTGRWGRG